MLMKNGFCLSLSLLFLISCERFSSSGGETENNLSLTSQSRGVVNKKQFHNVQIYFIFSRA